MDSEYSKINGKFILVDDENPPNHGDVLVYDQQLDAFVFKSPLELLDPP